MASRRWLRFLVVCAMILLHNLVQTRFVVVRRRRKRSNEKLKGFTLSNTNLNTSQSFINGSKVIICAVVKNEDRYVDEWLMYNKYLGFDFVHLYDNSEDGSAKIAYLPQKYGDFVKVQHLPGASIQVKAYNMCAKQYAPYNYWAAFIDGDEFIVLHEHDSIHELLADVVPSGGALSINRIFFGSNGHLHYDDKPVLQRFTARKNTVDNYVKTITYLPDALRIDNHFSRVRPGKRRVDCHGREIFTENTHSNTTEDVAAIYHYYTKSFDEFRAKRLRGDAYKFSRGVRYHRNDGEVTILNEFLRFDKEANVMFDTRAVEFFQQRQSEMSDFPPKQEVI